MSEPAVGAARERTPVDVAVGILIDAAGIRTKGLANRAPNLLAERAVYSLGS